MARGIPSWASFLLSIFNRFLVDFYSQLRPPESQKSSPRCSESTIFQKIAFRNWHRFLIDFGANLAPFCLPKSTKILSKIDSKMQQIFDRFLHRFFIDFWSILEPNLGPCWPLFRLKRGAAVRVRPLFCCVTFLNRFFSKCWPILAPFCSILVPSWLHFGSMLLPFWCQVGGILGHLAARAGTGWAGGVTPSFGSPIGLGGFAKRKYFFLYIFSLF